MVRNLKFVDSYVLTISVGIATTCCRTNDDNVIKMADDALYIAKIKKNTVMYLQEEKGKTYK